MFWYTVKQIKILSRVLVFFMCTVFGALVYMNSINIQVVADDVLVPYSNEPYMVPKGNVKEINNQFGQIINSTPTVSTILLYKFVANSETSIYSGRLSITSKSRDGSDFITRFKKYWLPMQGNTDKLQSLLLNNTHYETVETINKSCAIKSSKDSVSDCDEYKYIKKQYKAVLSMPIYDASDYSVKGYITFMLTKELSTDEQVLFINSMAPYLHKVAKLVNKK